MNRFEMAPLARTLEEEIDHCKKRIIEFEKFKGPIATGMVDMLKHRIDCLKAKQYPIFDVYQNPDPSLR